MDHKVCLANEHAERRGLPRSNKIGDAAAEGVKSRMGQSRTEILFWQQALFDPFKSRLATTPRREISSLDAGILPAPNTSACHSDVLHVGYRLVLASQMSSLWRSTTQLRQILILARDCHLPVMLEPTVLANGSLLVKLPRLLHLMINLALGCPAPVVVASHRWSS